MKKIIVLLLSFLLPTISKSQNIAAYSPVTDEYLSTEVMTKEEGAASKEWIQRVFKDDIPFSFSYNGKSSLELLKKWKRTDEVIEKNESYIVSRIKFTDPVTGVLCYADVKEFNNYPTAEWIVYFKNPGSEATPILENIQVLNTSFASPNSINNNRPEIYYSKGSQATYEDFNYKMDVLGKNSVLRYTSSEGRSSNDYLPFFYGDHYPLTDSYTSQAVWITYQLYRPNLKAGLIMAFRRPDSPFHRLYLN